MRSEQVRLGDSLFLMLSAFIPTLKGKVYVMFYTAHGLLNFIYTVVLHIPCSHPNRDKKT